MKDALEIKIITSNADDTEAIARKISKKLLGGEVIELKSDLGGGKTTFTRGFVGALSTDHVTSPSFTISNEYRTPSFEIVHYDFYRLNEAGLIKQALEEKIHDSRSVVIIEWADLIRDVLPKKRLTITFTVIDEQKRELNLSLPLSLKYLIEDL